MKKPIFTLFWWLIFLGGAFLRFHALDQQSLWDDEMSTRKVISTPLFGARAFHWEFEAHPPLFFVQLCIWKNFFGGSLPVLRANSALWGTLSLLALYGLALSFGWPSEAALFAMALLAFSPFHLAYSQEMRPYALAIFLGITGFWVLERLIKGGDEVKMWVVLFFILIAELYTHYWGAFVACAQGIYGLSQLKGRPRRVWSGLCVAAMILFSFWLPIVRDQVKMVGETASFWAYAPSFRNLVRTFCAFSGLYFHFASSDFLLPGPVLFRLLIGGIYAVGLILGIKRAPRAIVLWLVLGLGLPFALSYWKPTLYLWYRFPSLIYPAFVLCIVSGLWFIQFRGLKWMVLSLLFMAEFGGCWYYFNGWEKANPKSVVAYVDGQVTGNTVIIRPDYFADLFSFYNRSSAPVFDPNLEDSPEKRARFHGKDVLLVAFDVPSDPVVEAFRAEFKTVSAHYFPGFAHLGITVYSFR